MPTPSSSARAVTAKIVEDSTVAPFGLVPFDPLPAESLHAQEALNAAQASSQNALFTALVMNRVDKTARGAALGGAYGDTAQDSLRAGLLFAGAGLDQALKRLAESALPALVESDELAGDKFGQWAQKAVMHPDTGGVDPKRLVELLLGTGAGPRQVLIGRYVQALTANSAQSAERVDELATALGVKDRDIRKRCKPGTETALRSAFTFRNQISHELDLTEAPPAARARFERRRRSRTFGDMWDHAHECLQVTQLIVNDVGTRLAATR